MVKKHILILSLSVITFWEVAATPQIPDKLIYKGDTLSIFLFLPNEFYSADTVTFESYEYINEILNVNLFGNKKTCSSTACGREYQAIWEIVNDHLFLTEILSCCYDKDSIKADLTSLFGEKVIDGKVFADWITKEVFSQKGKQITFVNYSFPIHENDFEFVFDRGKLLNVKSYDNSKSRVSVYSQDHEKLSDIIHSNIDWDIIPIMQEQIVVLVGFSANEDGIIDEAAVMYGTNEILNKEAVRVVKLIPEWDVFYLKGRHFRVTWNVPVVFSEENREKYMK